MPPVRCCCECVIVGGVVASSASVCAANQLLSFAQDDYAAAYRLIKDVEPSTPQEYILKAVANAAIGQESGSVSA